MVKEGDKIRIISMSGEPHYDGKEGEVTHIDSLGQLHGTWGGLAVIPEEDKFEMSMEAIKIIDIRKPNLAAVKRGEVGQELVVVFSVNGTKFRMTYIQEHYFYCGMPGEWHERLKFEKISHGEVLSTLNCNGEFKIPHKDRDEQGHYLTIEAYAPYQYRGDDPRYLEADEKIVREYLVEPFVEKYY